MNFSGTPLATTFVNRSELTAAVPTNDLASAGTFPVTVSNPAPGGGTSVAAGFTVQAANNPEPTITSLSPSSASAGSASLILTVNGNGFIASSTVTFNGVSHAATFVNSGQLTISLSASDVGAVGSFAVVVSNPSPGGGPSNAVTFVLQSTMPTAPTITQLSPSSVSAGSGPTTLTILGTGFTVMSSVTFNGIQQTVTFINGTQLAVTLSATELAVAGTYAVVVTN